LKVLYDIKGWDGLSATEKTAYSYYSFLESGVYRTWGAQQQKDFAKLVSQFKIPTPLPSLLPLGKDRKGRNLEDYTIEEYEAYQREQEQLRTWKWESENFRERWEEQGCKVTTEPNAAEGSIKSLHQYKAGSFDIEKTLAELRRPLTERDVQEERERRTEISQLEKGKKMTKYAGDPVWDDVVPIPQDDGENPLAAIAYTDEYAEGTWFLFWISEGILTLHPSYLTSSRRHGCQRAFSKSP
jgi:protein farnesyltransferase/geranylgeranyltransferase type-1 subunit alpha